jgi:hypothetical protein
MPWMAPLAHIIETLDARSPTASIYAVKPWHHLSDAVVAEDDVEVPERFDYLLEVHLAAEVLQVWSEWRGGRQPDEACAALLHYAANDAYEPVEPDTQQARRIMRQRLPGPRPARRPRSPPSAATIGGCRSADLHNGPRCVLTAGAHARGGAGTAAALTASEGGDGHENPGAAGDGRRPGRLRRTPRRGGDDGRAR